MKRKVFDVLTNLIGYTIAIVWLAAFLSVPAALSIWCINWMFKMLFTMLGG